MRNNQAASRSKSSVMTRFCGSNLSLRQTRQVKHIVTLKPLGTLKKLRDLRLRNAALIEIEVSLDSS